MTRVRRTPYAVFYLEDHMPLDIDAIVAGDVPSTPISRYVLALAVLTGERYRLSRAELGLLMALPATAWVNEDDLDDAVELVPLQRAGLVVSDSEDPHLSALRERDEALRDNQWNVYAALYHYMTQWRGVRFSEGEGDGELLSSKSREAAGELVALHGQPPPAVVKSDAGDVLPLGRREPEGDLYRTLVARKTTRAFATDTPMTLDQLDVVLRYVFGVHGYARNAADDVCIKRTSPSGGGLHPIEAYPIVTNVEGAEPGIYHYNCGDHSLTKLEDVDGTEARGLATAFMCGQGYFGSAHVSIVLTARFARNHWKYRRHQKAYAGILMDAAHLSQTMYLVSAELGLGAFVTLAINGADIEERLGLDGVSEGVIAMTGCGPRAADKSPLELHFVASAADA